MCRYHFRYLPTKRVSVVLHFLKCRETTESSGALPVLDARTQRVPIKAWHDVMQDPTLADAILDRLVRNSYKVELKGESMRKKRHSDKVDIS